MELHPTADEHLEAIFAIRRLPAILANQFRTQPDDTIENWQRWLRGHDLGDKSSFRCTTILDDDVVIGHITQIDHSDPAGTTCQIGFNLVPEYWGRGLMNDAISQLLPSLFETHCVKTVVTGHFRGNVRCQRLVNRQGFQPLCIPVARRARIALEMRCLHWIKFWYTDRALWLSHMAKAANNNELH